MIGRNTKKLERVCSASQKTDLKVRSLYIGNPGTRPIAVYHRDDLLRYASYRVEVGRAVKPVKAPQFSRPGLEHTFRALHDLVHAEIARHSARIRINVESDIGPSRLQVTVNVGQTDERSNRQEL